jgi:hypothetical protein
LLKIGVIRKEYYHTERSRIYSRLKNLSLYGFLLKKKINKRVVYWILN